VNRGQAQEPAKEPGAAAGTDQHGKATGVAVAHLGRVDDESAGAGTEQAEKLLAQRWGAGDVKSAATRTWPRQRPPSRAARLLLGLRPCRRWRRSRYRRYRHQRSTDPRSPRRWNKPGGPRRGGRRIALPGWSAGRGDDPVLVDLAVDRRPRHSQCFGCFDLVAVKVQQGLHDSVAFHRLQRAEQAAAHAPAL
jgi:hypothetical protein